MVFRGDHFDDGIRLALGADGTQQGDAVAGDDHLFVELLLGGRFIGLDGFFRFLLGVGERGT